MEETAREMVRALRGKRSQVAFSRRLGFRGNPVAHWEAGRRTPTALEFFRACEKVCVDTKGALARFHPGLPPKGSAKLHEWLDALRANTSMAELARAGGHSRYSISRWMAGESSPRLHVFLELVEILSGRACDLVAELVPIEEVPSMGPAHAARRAARSLAHEEPWTEAVLRVLESHSCRPGDVSRQLGIDRSTEDRCIEKLIAARVVVERCGVFEVEKELNVDTRAVPALKAHWSNVARERLLEPLEEDLFSYNVLSASEEDVVTIREMLLSTYRQIRTLVSNSPATEKVALLNVQLVHFPRETRTSPTSREKMGTLANAPRASSPATRR